MTNQRVARRYAEALVDLAEERKNVDAMINDLELLRTWIKGSHELLLFLKSPIINHARKREIFLTIFADKLQKSTIESISVIAMKGREELLPDVIEEFLSLRDERQGIVRVGVRAAVEFSREQTSILREKLERYTSKKVEISFTHDAQLIGGFVARVGDTVFDGSIKRQLELLRRRFAEGNGMN